MYIARTRADLMIEVWEKLDCESVGRKEILEIEEAVRARFGTPAVESPMLIARLLADEGAELRHSEIMELFVERASDRPYDAPLRNILRLDDLHAAAASLRNVESLRRKLAADGDREGLRLLRIDVISGRDAARERSRDAALAAEERAMQNEVAEWLTHWLNTPEMFETWLAIRRGTADFKTRFESK